MFARHEQGQLATLSRRTLFFLVLSSIATGLSWLCYFRALQLGRPTFVSAVDKSSVVLILALSVLFLQEPLTWKTLAGALLITGGTVLFIA